MTIIKCGLYNLRNDDIWGNIISQSRAYNVRPLAFFSDVFIFQWLWNNMYILLLLMLSLHILNIFLVYKIAEKIGIKLNALCLSLFGLSPILVEAVYWISASTRIVLSVFLCLLSIYFLLLHIEERNKNKRALFLICSIILNLFCVGFYEQTIALNLFLFAFVLIVTKKYKYISIPILSTIIIGCWYLYFMLNGEMQSRGTLGMSGMLDKIVLIINKIYTLYINAYYDFKFSLGFIKEDIVNLPVMSAIILFIICIFIFSLFRNKFAIEKNECLWKKILFGLTIFVVPFLPFVVLESSIIANRNLYISTLGLAIIIGTLLDLILVIIKNDSIRNFIKIVIIALFTITFAMSNIEGTNNYKKVYELDNKVANQIIEAVGNKAFEEKSQFQLIMMVISFIHTKT